MKSPNHLIHQTSPYLLQHAYNPVNWHPWTPEVLQKAMDEDKPILLSIGYSACHWCHVMERESFENEKVAELMNNHFINIKVDREERPDVDAIYMDAVQAMGLQGGWPLNVFLMPDQKPFYGGTYFPTQNWMQLLQSVANAYKNHKAQLEESAGQFSNHIAISEIEKYGLQGQPKDFEKSDLQQIYSTIALGFDPIWGGMQRSPKFPMPSLWLFILRYAYLSKDTTALAQLERTLETMAWGGIYDQIRGGFARYSVDEKWFCPHFEKMLYDNGQLVRLYAEAWLLTKNPLYKQVVFQTLQFVEKELLSPEYGFYSALDADSEGIEGKFYTWTYQEISQIIEASELEFFCSYYNVTPEGNWEHGQNILFRKFSDQEFSSRYSLDMLVLERMKTQWHLQLLEQRSKRIRPGLDDKILAGWNAMMLRGTLEAYGVFGEKHFLELAENNARFILEKMWVDGQLKRTYKNGVASLEAYLEDYAALIDALAMLYQVTFDKQWLESAHQLLEYTLQNFYDHAEGLFFFTDAKAPALIARKKEIFDSVTASSNSVMAHNLYVIGTLLDEQNYLDISRKMLEQVYPALLKNGQYLSNWATLFSVQAFEPAEIVIISKEHPQSLSQQILGFEYFPNKILMGAKAGAIPTGLPLMQYKEAFQGQDTYYVCHRKTCKLPVHTLEKAFDQLKGESH